MAIFLAEIAFLLALGLFGLGLALWHQGRQATAPLLRAAGVVLVVGSVLAALSTGYFSVRYQARHELDRACLFHQGWGDGWGARGSWGPRGGGWGMRGPGAMGPGMMGRGMMGPWTPPETRPPGPPPAGSQSAPGAGAQPAQPESGSGAKPSP
jgi:hypothetical protein